MDLKLWSHLDRHITHIISKQKAVNTATYLNNATHYVPTLDMLISFQETVIVTHRQVQNLHRLSVTSRRMNENVRLAVLSLYFQ